MNKKILGISLISGLFGYGILKGIQSIKRDLEWKKELLNMSEECKLQKIHSLAQQIEVEVEMIKTTCKDKLTEDELNIIAKKFEDLKDNWGLYEFQKTSFKQTKQVKKSNIRWLENVIYVQLEEISDYLDGLIQKYKG